MFIPLRKADAAQRLVYGFIDETPDRAGEVMDYATAKPAFQSWSADMSKASDGKSLGNVRAQHDLKKAAGKLTDLNFDDASQRIEFVAHIVDDQEWAKVEAGVYTGFSPGGRYAKRWKDGAYTRYTPSVGELSIVDCPCIPTATFTMVKADGAEEEVGFVLDKAYEPGNEATMERAAVLAKAAGNGRKASDYVVPARAELIAENANEALAKMAEESAEEPKPDPVEALEKSLSTAEAVAAAAPVAEPTGPFADMKKAAAALKLITSADPRLAKGLYTVGWLAQLMDDFACLQMCLNSEAKSEGDGSAAPGDAAEILKRIGALLVQVTQEEVAEAVTEAGENAEVIVIAESDDMALATSIIDLVKADTDLMAKAGARNSKKDAETIQRMHDDAVALGADCGGDAEKAASAATVAENERLTKALGDAGPRIEKLTAAFEKLTKAHDETTAKLAELSKRAEPAKGVAIVVDKEGDGGGQPELKKTGLTLDEINAMPPGRARQRALNLYAAGQ